MASFRITSFVSYLVLVLLFPIALAIPAEPAHQPCDRRLRFLQPTRSLFTTVRDAIIGKIWAVPKQHHHPGRRHGPRPKSSASSNLRAQYGGDVVLRFNVSSYEALDALADASETLFLDVWESTDRWVDIRLSKEVVPLLLGLLPDSLQNAHTPLMHDLAQVVHESYPSNFYQDSGFPQKSHHWAFSSSLRKPENGPNGERDLFFQNYQPISVITPWMSLMASLFPTHTRLINIGMSFEGRDIPALKLGVHPTNDEQPSNPRKTIIILGGSHAREWISTSTVSYTFYQMITQYGKVPEITKFLEEFDWVFIPTINPDGYVYTWENDRLWRKNRQQTDLRFCQGVDLDRAWGFKWDGESTKSNPCSESYAGIGPFDGVEARRLADWAKNETEKNNVNFVAFLDFHSYSQQVLYPYSYSCSSSPPSLENLEELAMGLAKAIRLTNNQFYEVSSACEGGFTPKRVSTHSVRTKMELGGGSALDWFYHELGVKYAYQIKLRDTGSYGFLLPKENIVPTGQEAYNAITGLGRFLLSNKGIESTSLDTQMGVADEGMKKDRKTVTETAAEPEEDEMTEQDDNGFVQQELRRRRR